MNANDILDMIGDAKGAYIWDAQRSRRGETAPAKKSRAARKLWLIAAAAALALLLIGCVAYALSLNRLKLGEISFTDNWHGTTEVHSLLSLQGYIGSPSYQAGKEWFDWLETYNPDETERLTDEEIAREIPEEYGAYNLYTLEMKDKVDEICAKYGLDLLGRPHYDPNTEDAFRALNIQGILKPEAQVESDLMYNYFYANGSFKVEGLVTLTGDSNPWPYPSLIGFRCSRKDAFDEVVLSIDATESYDQWTYTTSDGVEVLLALGPKNALMIVDKADYFITVMGIDTKAGNILDGEHTMDRAALEAIAEIFDFTIEPQRVSAQELAAADQRREEYDRQYAEQMVQAQQEYDDWFQSGGYEGRVRYYLENSSHANRMGYCLKDLDGNGTPELIIGKDGYITHVFGEKDGAVTEILYLSYFDCCFWTEAGFLITDTEDAYGRAVRFIRMEDEEPVIDLEIEYRPHFYSGEDGPWRRTSSAEGKAPITEEAFHEIADSQKRVVLEMKPLAEYPMDAEVRETDDRNVTFYTTGDSYEEIVRKALLEPEEVAPGEYIQYSYALVDLDGDGQDEFFWQKHWNGGDFYEFYTMRDGKPLCLYSGKEVTLCKGGIVEVASSYSGSNKTYCYYRMENGRSVMVDYLRYDADKDPQNPWFRSSDASGQDISMVPVTQAEFDSIRAKYPAAEPELIPAEEFSLTK